MDCRSRFDVDGSGPMKFLVLAREDMRNQVRKESLGERDNGSSVQILTRRSANYRYGCMGKIVANRGELNDMKLRSLLNDLE